MKRADATAAEPYVREIPYAEPVTLAARLTGQRNMTLLDSSMRHPRLGRYSYLSCDPVASLIVRSGVTIWNGKPQVRSRAERAGQNSGGESHHPC